MIYEYNLHHLNEIKSKYKQHIKYICIRGFDRIYFLKTLKLLSFTFNQKRKKLHDKILFSFYTFNQLVILV